MLPVAISCATASMGADETGFASWTVAGLLGTARVEAVFPEGSPEGGSLSDVAKETGAGVPGFSVVVLASTRTPTLPSMETQTIVVAATSLLIDGACHAIRAT